MANPDRGGKDGTQPLAVVLVDFGLGVDAVGDAVRVEVFEACSRRDQLGRQPIHVGVALVADDDPPLGVDHAQPVRHVGERHREAPVLDAQLDFALLQSFVPAPQLVLDAAPIGEIANSVDLVGPGAATQGSAHDLDLDHETGRRLEEAFGSLARRVHFPAGHDHEIADEALSQKLVRCVEGQLQNALIDVDDDAVLGNDETLERRIDEFLVANERVALACAGDKRDRQ
jgi:hypothetical protein